MATAETRIRPLAGLTRKNALREVLAGVTLLALAIPLNIGYSQIAGLPATAGLYALILPAIVYVVLASSRQLVVSPDAAAAALVASSVGGLAIAGSEHYLVLAMAQALISGVMFLGAAVFRLGAVANFLSKPILVGFVGGLALGIMVSQIAKMLGVDAGSSSEFGAKVVALFTGLSGLSPISAVMSAASVLLLLIGRRYAPAVPWALIVLILATITVALFDLGEGAVAVLGPVDGGLPTLSWPQLDAADWLALVPSALALTLVTTAEGLMVARSYAEKNGQRSVPDRDLAAIGAANVAAGVSGGFAVGASTSRTAAMDQAGSRTQLPTLIAAVGTLALVLFGTALLEDIPLPAIGAVVAVAIIPLLGVSDFRMLWRRDRFEFVIAVVCFLVTLLVGAIHGIFVALVLALINAARSASDPAIEVLAPSTEPGGALVDAAPPGTMTAPGVLVIRISGPLFFGNAADFADTVQDLVQQQSAPVRHVILDLESVTGIDVTAGDSLDSLRSWLRDHDIELGYSRASTRLIDRMRSWGLIDDEPIYPTNRAALDAVTDG